MISKFGTLFAAAVLASQTGAPAMASAQSLWDYLQANTQSKTYQPVNRETVELARALFTRTLKGERGTDLASAWGELGFQMIPLELGMTAVIETDQRGQGAYIVRLPDRSDAIALQAPHRYKDLYTGEIAARLFEESAYAALAVNTAPRRYEDGDDVVDADLAHHTETLYIAFSEAFATVYPRGAVVQLHGFSQAKRRSQAGRSADVIVSSGQSRPSRIAMGIGRCLKEKTDHDVRTYPEEVNELGGTTNTVGRALRARQFDGFVHVELARAVRDVLKDQGEQAHQQRRILNQCITQGHEWGADR